MMLESHVYVETESFCTWCTAGFNTLRTCIYYGVNVWVEPCILRYIRREIPKIAAGK